MIVVEAGDLNSWRRLHITTNGRPSLMAEAPEQEVRSTSPASAHRMFDLGARESDVAEHVIAHTAELADVPAILRFADDNPEAAPQPTACRSFASILRAPPALRAERSHGE